MRRYYLPALLTLLFFPLPAAAQTGQEDQSNAAQYGGYAKDFLFGQPQEEEDGEEKPPVVWQYGSKYKKAPAPKTGIDKLLPTGEMFLYFVRTENAQPGEATLRLVSPYVVTGCVNMIQPAISIRQSGGTMAFKIEDGTVKLDKSVQYAHFQCDLGSNFAFVDIPFGHDEFASGNIKKLKFQSSGGGSDTYAVEMNGSKVTLHPKTMAAFKPFTGSGQEDPLSHDFKAVN